MNGYPPNSLQQGNLGPFGGKGIRPMNGIKGLTGSLRNLPSVINWVGGLPLAAFTDVSILNSSLGLKFTVTEPMMMTEVGIFDSNQNGLTTIPTVKLWADSVVNMSWIILPSDNKEGVWCFQRIGGPDDALLLLPGVSYTLAIDRTNLIDYVWHSGSTLNHPSVISTIRRATIVLDSLVIGSFGTRPTTYYSDPLAGLFVTFKGYVSSI
jgi:hypothetical protein